MLQVFGDGTCGGLHQQLSHPPKQCHDGETGNWMDTATQD